MSRHKSLKEKDSKKAVSKPLVLVALSITAILVLVFLSSTKKGLTEETKTVQELSQDKLMQSNTNQRIVVQEITLTNSYFLPRTHQLKRLQGCIYDTDGTTKATPIGLSYGEAIQKGSPFSLGMAREMSSMIYYGSYDQAEPIVVELKPYETKKVELLMTPSAYYSSDINLYDYEELLLVDVTDSKEDYGYYGYNVCPSIGDETRSKSGIIPLTKQTCDAVPCRFSVSAQKIFEDGGISVLKAQRTGINVRQGQTLTFTASGCWSCGSAYPCSYDWLETGGCYQWPVGRLEGQIGNCQHFVIGKSYKTVAGCDGELYLGMYDSLNSQYDNSGYVTVDVKTSLTYFNQSMDGELYATTEPGNPDLPMFTEGETYTPEIEKMIQPIN